MYALSKAVQLDVYAQYYQTTKKLQDDQELVLDQTTHPRSSEDHQTKDGIHNPIEVHYTKLHQYV